MKGNGLFSMSVVILLVGFLAGPAAGSYGSIQHNLVNGTGDIGYSAGTGVFWIDDSSTNLTLNDDPELPVAGVVTYGDFSLTTNFINYNVKYPNAALFMGGTAQLNFGYDPDGPGGAPAQDYSIGGPINGAKIWIEKISSTKWRIKGSGLFSAGTPSLPGSNIWDATGFSSINTISVETGQNLDGWDWTDTITGKGETQYTMTPDESAAPEPATLALLGLGVLAVARRRRA